MDIPEFGSLKMIRTDEAHYGHQKLLNTQNAADVLNAENAARTGIEKTRASFGDFLVDAVKSMNQKQLDVSAVQEKLMTNPDEVDIQDVTIAMSKARSSLDLAKSVIDRLVQGWNEITTTR